MDNQHRKIKGYRELNQSEIDLMNRIKHKGIELGELVAELRAFHEPHACDEPAPPPSLDQRWISIGQTHLQQGLMALTRAVARPDFF